MSNPTPPSPDARDLCAELRDWADSTDERPDPHPWPLAPDVLRRAADEIDRLRGDGWVRCSERLPEEGERVLTLWWDEFARPQPGLALGFAHWRPERGYWSAAIGNGDVRYWSPTPPLPPPPSEGGE